MSIRNRKTLIVVAGIGLVVGAALVLSAGPASATEAKPCKDKQTTTTTAKPKPTTTTVKAKPQAVTTTTVKHQTSAQRPTTTTVEVATPEQIETPLYDSTPIVKSSTPTELAHTGAMTTWLSLIGAALCGIGWVVLRLRNRLAS
jgi:LPXTG-motif cell wall-anchored protein